MGDTKDLALLLDAKIPSVGIEDGVDSGIKNLGKWAHRSRIMTFEG